MIIDTLAHDELYHSVHPSFKAAFAFIKQAVAENLAVGRYEIDGKDLFAIIQDYTTRQPEDAKAETHRQYIDIQCVVSGAERIDVWDIAKATASTEYNTESDVQFFENEDCAVVSVLRAGDYGIYFPHDVHRPCMCPNGDPQPVTKIVVKVRV